MKRNTPSQFGNGRVASLCHAIDVGNKGTVPMSRIRLLIQAGMLVCSVAAIPAAAQTAGQDQTAPPQGFTAQPRGGAGRFIQRFQAANTTGDGHLTLAQAQAAHMPMIVRNFDAIDAQHKGYVTLQDLRAWRQQMRAERRNSGNSTN